MSFNTNEMNIQPAADAIEWSAGKGRAENVIDMNVAIIKQLAAKGNKMLEKGLTTATDLIEFQGVKAQETMIINGVTGIVGAEKGDIMAITRALAQ